MGDPVQRDIDVLWELVEAQPRNKEIAVIAARVLALRPADTDARMVLARHRYALLDLAEARRLYEEVAAAGDVYALDAARNLVSVSTGLHDPVSALKWAGFVLDRDQGDWEDWLNLGEALVANGEFDAAYPHLDRAVDMCARTDPDALPRAMQRRILVLMETFAPPEVLVPAAEAIARVRDMDETVAYPLAWAYLQTGRFEEAERLSRQILRIDPMSGAMRSIIDLIDAEYAAIEKEGYTRASLARSGFAAKLWKDRHEKILGVGTAAALRALDELLPPEAKAALRPPQDPAAADEGPMITELAEWHAGQNAGGPDIWGLPGPLRLLGPEEIAAREEAIKNAPEAHPGWVIDDMENEYSLVLTDDADSCLIEKVDGAVVIRRTGADDVAVSDSLSDWLWSRVGAFGGQDPRPPRPQR